MYNRFVCNIIYMQKNYQCYPWLATIPTLPCTTMRNCDAHVISLFIVSLYRQTSFPKGTVKPVLYRTGSHCIAFNRHQPFCGPSICANKKTTTENINAHTSWPKMATKRPKNKTKKSYLIHNVGKQFRHVCPQAAASRTQYTTTAFIVNK